jgi:ABC-type multidrug transport system ATPase subunit
MDVVVEGLTVDFADRGVRAVADLDLHVGAGEHVAVLGPSGAGKTTLLRALLGAVTPSAGAVRVGGRDPNTSAGDRAEVRRRTGAVRQAGDLVPRLTARTNAVLGTSGWWRPRDAVTVATGRVPQRWRLRLEELARAQGIDDVLDAPVATLSGGQQRRVALVRALLPDPTLLLADEPTTGLDPAAAAAAVAAMRAVPGVTLLVSTHDLAVARRFPRIVALRHGALVHDAAVLDDDHAAAVYGRSR